MFASGRNTASHEAIMMFAVFHEFSGLQYCFSDDINTMAIICSRNKHPSRHIQEIEYIL